MTLRRGLVLAGLAVWAMLGVAWMAGLGGEVVAYVLVAVTLLLAWEGVAALSRRVRARGRSRDA